MTKSKLLRGGVLCRRNYITLFLGVCVILMLGMGGFTLLRKKQSGSPVQNPLSTPTQDRPLPAPIPEPEKEQSRPGFRKINIPEGWERYVNEEFAVAFDYPGDWELRGKLRGNVGELALHSPVEQQEFYPPTMYIYFATTTGSIEKFEIILREKNKKYKWNDSIVRTTLNSGLVGLLVKSEITEAITFFLSENKRIAFVSIYIPLDMDIVNTLRLIEK